MTQQTKLIEAVVGYLRHQGAKSLQELARLMDETEGEWQRCLEGMTEEQALAQPTRGDIASVSPAAGEGPKWCAKEVIGHYLASERSLNRRVAQLAGVQPPPGPAPAVRAMGAQSPEDEALPLDHLRGKLETFFQETRALIGALEQGSNLDQTFPHPVFGELNLKEWMAFHRVHGRDHIGQIETIKGDPVYPKE